MYADLHVKCPLLLSEFNQKFYVSTNFCQNPEYEISGIISLLWVALFWRSDGQTDTNDEKDIRFCRVIFETAEQSSNAHYLHLVQDSIRRLQRASSYVVLYQAISHYGSQFKKRTGFITT
jgi:hypothetical protein